jgi:hypothetical protein
MSSEQPLGIKLQATDYRLKQYFHNFHSLGGELLPLHHVAEGDGVDGVKRATGAAPAASPLLSLESSDQFRVFCVSLPPRVKSPKEGVYIVSFKSRRVRGVQDCIKTMHEGQYGPHHMARIVAGMVGPLSFLVASPIDFLFSRSSISQKNDVAKSLCLFDVLKVPKSQKHARRRKSAS